MAPLQVNLLETLVERSNHYNGWTRTSEGGNGHGHGGAAEDRRNDGRDRYERAIEFVERSPYRNHSKSSSGGEANCTAEAHATNNTCAKKTSVPLSQVLSMIDTISNTLSKIVPKVTQSTGTVDADTGTASPSVSSSHVLSGGIQLMANEKSADTGAAFSAAALPTAIPQSVSSSANAASPKRSISPVDQARRNMLNWRTNIAARAKNANTNTNNKSGNGKSTATAATAGKKGFAEGLLQQASTSRRPARHMGWSEGLRGTHESAGSSAYASSAKNKVAGASSAQQQNSQQFDSSLKSLKKSVRTMSNSVADSPATSGSSGDFMGENDNDTDLYADAVLLGELRRHGQELNRLLKEYRRSNRRDRTLSRRSDRAHIAHPLTHAYTDKQSAGADTVDNLASAMFAPSASSAARQTLLKRWTSCFPGSATSSRRFHVGVAADIGFYTAHNSSLATVQAKISAVFSQANAVFLTQVGVYLSVAQLDMRNADGGPDWNSYGRADSRQKCLTTSALLDSMATWRASTSPSTRGAWMLMTDCFPPPGTVGYAYIGTSCLSKHSVGWSSLSTALWRTTAHEFAHILGASHSSLGGVMDPTSDGRLSNTDSENPGEYGFDNVTNKPDMCEHITKSLAGTNTVFSGNTRISNEQCWGAMTLACGNGVVETGEECDPPSACCTSDCRWRPPADCNNSGPCCVACRAQPVTLPCDDGKGYCAAGGQCAASVCGNYQGLEPCGVDPTNVCLQRCLYQGTCIDLSTVKSNGQTLPFAVPNGSPCGVASERPTATCKTTSLSESTCVPAKYQWYAGEYGACSRCYNGTQARTVHCVDITTASVAGDGSTAAVVHTDNCAGSGQPTAERACSSSCDYKWELGAWSACTGPCGTGQRTRSVQCVVDNHDASTSTELVVAAEVLCVTAFGAKPVASEGCALTSSCTYRWVSGDWGSCSIDCGTTPGNQTRDVTCARVGDSTNAAVDVSLCTATGSAAGTKPDVSRSCQNSNVCVFAWELSTYGTCTAACVDLPGIRTRTVTCVGLSSAAVSALGGANNVPSVLTQTAVAPATGVVTSAGRYTVTDTRCVAADRPEGAEPCTSTEPCTYQWVASEWGQCSSDCGRGTQRRTLSCVKTGPGAGALDLEPSTLPLMPIPPQSVPAALSLCAVAEKPTESRSCAEAEGCAELLWYTGAWEMCSAACVKDGNGTQTRQVVCTERAQVANSPVRGGDYDAGDAACLTAVGAKPTVVQNCRAPWACVFGWAAGTWGDCVVDAAAAAGDACVGQQTRSVYCAATGDPAKAPVALGNCASVGSDTLPTTTRACIPQTCGGADNSDSSSASNAAAAAADYSASAMTVAMIAAATIGVMMWAAAKNTANMAA